MLRKKGERGREARKGGRGAFVEGGAGDGPYIDSVGTEGVACSDDSGSG